MCAKLDNFKSPHSSKEVVEEEPANQDSLVERFPTTEHCQLSESALQLLVFAVVLSNWYCFLYNEGKPSLCSYSYISCQQQKSGSGERVFPSLVTQKCSFSDLNM